jgi:hypothetical protein
MLHAQIHAHTISVTFPSTCTQRKYSRRQTAVSMNVTTVKLGAGWYAHTHTYTHTCFHHCGSWRWLVLLSLIRIFSWSIPLSFYRYLALFVGVIPSLAVFVLANWSWWDKKTRKHPFVFQGHTYTHVHTHTHTHKLIPLLPLQLHCILQL